jgi:hypothetical protein
MKQAETEAPCMEIIEKISLAILKFWRPKLKLGGTRRGSNSIERMYTEP